MGVLAFIAGLVFVAALSVLLATFKNLGNEQSISRAQEDARKDTLSGPSL